MGLFATLRARLFGSSSDPPDSAAPSEPASAAEPESDEMARRARKRQPAATQSAPVQPSASEPATIDVSARQERAASRLLDDERLRGDLTDEEFRPLLDWAMAASDRLVASTAGDADELADKRIDVGLSVVRETVAAAGDAVRAYADGDHSRLQAALKDAGLLPRDARADGIISRLFVQSDLTGPEVAAQIASQLPTGPDAASGNIVKDHR